MLDVLAPAGGPGKLSMTRMVIFLVLSRVIFSSVKENVCSEISGTPAEGFSHQIERAEAFGI